jgi:hypothetical protein
MVVIGREANAAELADWSLMASAQLQSSASAAVDTSSDELDVGSIDCSAADVDDEMADAVFAARYPALVSSGSS